ncbi:T5orf172 domain-containing protein [Candidatus Pelagibacter ubique]|uniref:T5orf172 domain-containing protein n=1 Tax=Pelagibacter ubique TaxID=198252 RepID=A0ABX1T3P7_PELUQ|nr:GIY-YIG nuclease family protein [Candidatus Pelagibacter ubique]NMN67880.1 T5orf172 domain-containing protein [Candidatus Pelagibacter ubique]
MLDFDNELKKILKDDPLGILKIRKSQSITTDQRLKVSFEEINKFIDENEREPEESIDISERKLFSRLKELKKDFGKASILKDLDRHNLLENVKENITVDDILSNDVLGLLDDDPVNIFDLKNIPKNKNKTDFVARRKPCENFKDYENNFKTMQKEIKEGKRKLITHKEHHLKEGRYFVLDGILLFLEKIEDPIVKEFNDKTQGKRKRLDPRIRCIFENGLESNMYLRSLGKELYNNGSTVIQSNDEALDEFTKGFNGITDKDNATGHIYVLSSLSKKAEINSIRDLYKIGYCTTSIETRIENAENETTFLMAPVKIMSAYKTFNLDPQKFESIIHNFFSERCLDVKIADKKGNYKMPKEWYIVSLNIIDEIIQLTINNQIHNYKFDHLSNKILHL